MLCSYINTNGTELKPFTPTEWFNLAKKMLHHQLQPADLMNFSKEDYKSKLDLDASLVQRILALLDRGANLTFELEKYHQQGINIITKADREFPKVLKIKLANTCPPLFYYAGDLDILKNKFIGFVGSRNIEKQDQNFAELTTNKILKQNYSIVSGGAKGIDTVSENIALNRGIAVTEYMADSMVGKMRKVEIIKAIQNAQLLLLSAVSPNAGFNAGNAMMRNAYIYAQAEAAVVVKADLQKGGTWNGAISNLRHHWCKTLCWKNAKYPGNMELIKRGAIAIDENWDGKIEHLNESPIPQQGELFNI